MRSNVTLLLEIPRKPLKLSSNVTLLL